MGDPSVAPSGPADGDVDPRTAATPAMPAIKTDEKVEWPVPVTAGTSLAIGWVFAKARKGGPFFATLRQSAVIGSYKVLERFPLTEQGWDAAWLRFASLDGAPVKKTLAALDRRVADDRARARMAELAVATVVRVRGLTFLGGHEPGPDLEPGKLYDLCFLQDRVVVVGLGVIQEIPYSEVDSLEIGGPGVVSRMSRGQQAGVTAAFGVLGAAVAYGSTKIQTVIDIRLTRRELHFLCTTTVPDALRIQLAQPLGTIREARASQEVRPGLSAATEATFASELYKLADLMDRGLLTREEFDQFKERLLSGS